jgi:hypothetical protein
MTDTQNQVLVTDFTNQIMLESQQATSFFRGKILEAPVKGKIFEHQNLGATDPQSINSRFQTVNLSNPVHTRRGAAIQGYYQAIGIDNDDQLKALVDLGSGYAKSIAAGMMRQVDRTIAEAAIGSVLTGENFTTSTSFASDGGQSVTAGSGLTYDILREVKRKFNAKGVGLNAGEQLYIACTDVQAETLFNEIEVISSDYNSGGAAQTGNLPEVLGFKIVVFPSSPTTGNSIIAKPSTRSCFAFSNDGLKLGMLSDIQVKYEDRADLVDTKQVKILARFAALRTEGTRVIKIDVTE